MNFADGVKAEIFSKGIKEKHCRKAFFAGLLRGAGALYEKDGELGLDIKAGGEDAAEFIASQLKSVFNYDLREVSVSEDKLNKKDKFVLSVSGDVAVDILNEFEILVTEGDEQAVNLKFYGDITQKECCLRAFIRGLFVSSGNCTIPDENSSVNTGYHLEIVFSHYTPALETSEKLAEYGVLTKITRRRDNYIVYIKSAEEIKDFLAFLPAPRAVLKLTDIIINREVANRSNRQKNCDLGNVNKQVDAAAKQIAAIRKIKQTVGLDALKDSDRAVAVAREENPDETLNELAERLNLTKSCLNHRLRKIVALANEL